MYIYWEEEHFRQREEQRQTMIEKYTCNIKDCQCDESKIYKGKSIEHEVKDLTMCVELFRL